MPHTRHTRTRRHPALPGRLACWALIGLMLMAATPQHTTIFMIGDSTMANKDTTGGKQERGWGMMLGECFDAQHIRIDNHAVNGRSTLSFINEGRWQRVAEQIRPGDYVVIQFGHNDEKPQADRHTEPGSTFDANLERFVSETRARGGIPVLMNSVVRRNFVGDADTLTDTHGAYRTAPRTVAKRLNVPFVDANRITQQLEERMGREGSKRLHMWFAPGEEPSLPQGRQDNTHYNIFGARTVARLLADALCQEVPQLRPFRTNAGATAKTGATAAASSAKAGATPTASFDNPDTIVVALDGTGHFRTIGAAIEACRAFMDYHKVIYIRNGTYREKLIVPQWLQNVELCGESADGTIITYDDHANLPLEIKDKRLKIRDEVTSENNPASHPSSASSNPKLGTFRTYTLKIEGNAIVVKNLTVQNNAPQLGQAVALHTEGDRLVFVGCRFIGNQDTVYTGLPGTRLYFKDCFICGTTDFIFGPATAWFEGCTIQSLKNSYVTAASTPQDVAFGYIFSHCRLIAAEGADRVYLGRPWRDYGYTLFMHCELGAHIRPEGWHHWQPHREQTARYYEYQNYGPGADTSGRVGWSRQLSKKEAKAVTLERVFSRSDDWVPAL